MMIFDDYFSGRGVTINAMHPGSVKTEAGRDNGPLYTWFKHHVMERNFRSPEVSSETPKGISGRFLNLTTEEEPAPPALDREVARELWDISLRMGGLLEES
jgi:NAD(P)-dependent dehydrogenase (short-subunit alcohol dehydrogenase family)